MYKNLLRNFFWGIFCFQKNFTYIKKEKVNQKKV